MTHVKKIHVSETYPLRQAILRPNQDLEQCQYPGDLDENTGHFGAYAGEDLVGIVSIYQCNNQLLLPEAACQLRAMATVERVRGMGIGFKLLQRAEEHASMLSMKHIWANARTSACGFYRKAGYRIEGEEFVIAGVGPHYTVLKDLS